MLELTSKHIPSIVDTKSEIPRICTVLPSAGTDEQHSLTPLAHANARLGTLGVIFRQMPERWESSSAKCRKVKRCCK
eukprot:9525368-Lingulodinium_polyedra.AAC.1